MMKLSPLPKGWVWTRLGEICLDPQYGWTTSAITEGALHLLRTTDITSGNIDWNTVPFCKEEPSEKEKYLLKDGDIVISRAGSVGYSHLIKNPKEAIFASYLIRFRPLIDEKYLAFFIKSPLYWDSISEKSLGIAIPNVNASKLKQISIPLPPLPEQRRIVAKFEELFTKLDAGVLALKKTQAQLKRYRQSVLKAACEGKLVLTEAELAKAEGRDYEHADVLMARINDIRKRNTKGKYIEMPTLDISDLPKLPEGWLWVQAQDVCNWITNGYTPKANKMFQENGEIPFIKVYNLTNKGELDFSKNPTFISKETHTKELFRSNVFPGDILMNIVGPPLGKVSIVPDIFPEWNINQAIVIYRPLDGFDRKFLCYSLLTDNILSWAIKRSKATAGQFNLTITICRNLPLPLPPLAEQRRIVAEVERRLSVADEVARTVEQSLAQAERLRQSILKKSFEGRLVAQDANDEPAGVLLERIRHEKAQQANTDRKKKDKRKNSKD